MRWDGGDEADVRLDSLETSLGQFLCSFRAKLYIDVCDRYDSAVCEDVVSKC